MKTMNKKKCKQGTSLTEKFWYYTEKKGIDDCWEWKAGKNRKNGYGRIRHNGKNYLCHRLSYDIHFNNRPDNMLVLHKCDNPGCVNPHHLFLGTQIDNIRDMCSKNRQSRHSIKHTEETKQKIRLSLLGRKRPPLTEKALKNRQIGLLNMITTNRIIDLPKGVEKTKSGKYAARICFNNKKQHLGVFNTPEEASKQVQCVRRIYLRSLGV